MPKFPQKDSSRVDMNSKFLDSQNEILPLPLPFFPFPSLSLSSLPLPLFLLLSLIVHPLSSSLSSTRQFSKVRVK